MIFSVWGHVHTTFAILHFPPLTPCLHFHATSLTKLLYCICFWDTSFPLPVQISYNLFWFTKTRYRTNRPAAIMGEASWIYGFEAIFQWFRRPGSCVWEGGGYAVVVVVVVCLLLTELVSAPLHYRHETFGGGRGTVRLKPNLGRDQHVTRKQNT